MPDTSTGGGRIFGMKKNEAIVAGVGAAALLGIVLYRYQKQQQAAQAAAAAAAAAQAPGTGAGTSDEIDPSTGFPYGSAEDASALTTMSGYNSPVAGLGYNDTSYLYGGGAYYPGSGYPLSSGFTSNAQWSQAAEDYLVNTGGGDANTVGNALGKYITGQPVDAAGQAIINQAIAFEGYPPVSGPDGYPPSIRTGTTPPPPAAQITVPNVVGQNLLTAIANIQKAGLKEHTITMAAYGNPGNWKVNGQNPAAGSKMAAGGTVNLSAVHK